MALSAKPPKKRDSDPLPSKVDEEAVKAVISRGGTAPSLDSKREPQLKLVQLRLYSEIIERIDAEVMKIRVARCKPKFSRHKWLEEAIEEKLARNESQSLG